MDLDGNLGICKVDSYYSSRKPKGQSESSVVSASLLPAALASCLCFYHPATVPHSFGVEKSVKTNHLVK